MLVRNPPRLSAGWREYPQEQICLSNSEVTPVLDFAMAYPIDRLRCLSELHNHFTQ
jgi:hypothetical protein